MTQARDTLPLRLQLTPMQLSEGMPLAVGGQKHAPETAIARGETPMTRGCQLVIHPGEPGEILVQLENLENRTLYLHLQAEGNFPREWCRLGIEGSQLPPLGKIEAVLYFQIPLDFFESSDLTTPGKPLTLDYRGRLHLSYTLDNPAQSEGEPTFISLTAAEFTLYIRPRSLYLDFLPELYREVDFIGRLLKIFEQAFEPAVQTLDALWAYLDPLTAPEALLPFLAHWVGWPLSLDTDATSHISIARQRYLIRQAVELYRWRGTKRGLRLYLHLYTDLPLDEHLPEGEKHISIEEVFGRGFVMGEAHLGQDAIVGGGQPFHFVVHLRCHNPRQIDRQLVRTIIEQEKPAFCIYDLYIESIY